MTVVVQPSSKRLGQLIAGSRNGVNTQQTQQQAVISATGVVGGIVAQNGVILTTPAGTPGPTWPYLFNSSTANADPGTAHLAFNSSVSVDVTQVYVDYVDLAGGVIMQQLSMLPRGAMLTVAGGAYSVSFTVTGVTVNNNYVTLAVDNGSGTNAIPNGTECELLVTTGFTRYGTQYFDQYGVLQAQIDQFGVHSYYNLTGSNSGPAVYVGELLPSGWTPLALASGITYAASGRGAVTPSVRLDPAGVVRLKGQLYNSSGSSIAEGTTLATLPGVPPALNPSGVVQIGQPSYLEGATVTPGTAYLFSNGTISLDLALPSEGVLSLDGVTYTVD